MKIKKIGLLLASIHTSTAVDYYKQFVQKSKESEQTLIVFPGGRLNYEDDFEYLRNSIYPLVNEANLDFLISWGSSLGGKTTLNDLSSFLSSFSSIPYLTLTHKMENHSNISFDAYSCMKNEIIHLIDVHGCKKIAFLRGPKNHKSAQDRYNAYYDVLKLRNIEIDENLISSPVPWNKGNRAIKELIEKRNLKPSKDFDAIVCVNDSIMFATMDYLYSEGYSIPKDVKIIGFNDSKEALLTPSPGTTAKMPLEKMSTIAWHLALEGESYAGDFNLPCKMVIRKSCGCTQSPYATDLMKRENCSIEDFCHVAGEILEVPSNEIYEIAENGERSLVSNDWEKFELLFSFKVYKYLKATGDIYSLFEVIKLYVNIFGSEFFKTNVYLNLLQIIQNTQNRLTNEKYYFNAQQKTTLIKLKASLLNAKTFKDIIRVVKDTLYDLQINELHLVFSDSDYSSEYMGGYKHGEIFENLGKFSSQNILPENLSDYDNGCYVVLPLYTANESIGYLFVHTDNEDGEILEEIRSIISSAIETTLLFKAANRAKESAEKSEKLKSLFFANLDEGIKSPLNQINNIAEQIDNDELQSSVKKVNRIIDLSLMDFEETELEFTTTDLNELLISSDFNTKELIKIPTLVLDRERLLYSMNSFSDLMTQNSIETEIETIILADNSVEIYIKAQKDLERFSSNMIFHLLEKIVFLHNGSISLKDNYLTISLPYPSLSNNNENYGKNTYHIVDSLKLNENYLTLQEIMNNGFPSNIRKIYWEIEKHDFASNYVLNKIFKEIPNACFICYDVPQGYKNIAMAFSILNTKGEKPLVYYCGKLSNKFEKIKEIANFIEFKSNNQLNSLSLTENPQLVIFNKNKNILESHLSQIMDVDYSIIYFDSDFNNDYILKYLPQEYLLFLNDFMMDNEDFFALLTTFLIKGKLSVQVKNSLINKTISYINKNAKKQISRLQIAEYVQISEDYLSKIFKQGTGISPWTYLTLLRIYLAEQLIRNTNKTMSEIASETGFQDQAYLCRVFKKIKKVTPNSYRKKN